MLTLQSLPEALAAFDTTRVTLVYFALSGLDVLNALDTVKNKDEIIKWIYSLQVINEKEQVSGFQGSTTFCATENPNVTSYQWGHLATTYCSLCSLLILGDDLSNVNKEAIISSLKALQLPNGCYKAAKDGTESDMRFLFCAASICYILKDWSGMDIDKATNFILDSMSYDFGIAQGPHLESHGGSSYCAIATLALTNRLHCLSDQQRNGLIRWLLNRQEDGFQGRPNKPVDTCYSFWIGAALKILNAFDLVDFKQNQNFVMLTQHDVFGGFAKWIDYNPDPLHTYLGLAGLSLMKYEGLNEVMPELNITYRADRKSVV